jgi:hypothetical protein
VIIAVDADYLCIIESRPINIVVIIIVIIIILFFDIINSFFIAFVRGPPGAECPISVALLAYLW